MNLIEPLILYNRNDNDIFSVLPTHEEKGTLTGNNDGPEIIGGHNDNIIVGTDHQ